MRGAQALLSCALPGAKVHGECTTALDATPVPHSWVDDLRLTTKLTTYWLDSAGTTLDGYEHRVLVF